MRALQPVPPAAGTGVVGYQVADYLDQYGRRTRTDQLGPAALWDALTVGAATASDLTRLALAARDRGLYRHAALLWTAAATLGNAEAAGHLIIHLRRVSPVDTMRAAQWAVAQASLDDPWAVAWLLRELREAEASDAVSALLARDPAAQTSLDDPGAVAELLRELRAAGASDAVTALLARDSVAQTSLDSPRTVGELLRELRAAGASDAAADLGARAATQASLDDPEATRALLEGMVEVRADLAARAAARVSLDDPGAVAELLEELRAAGASDAVTTLLARNPAARVSLDDPGAVAELLEELHAAGAGRAVTTLAIRAANAGMFDLFLEACPGGTSSCRFGREPDGTPSHSWRWQEPTG